MRKPIPETELLELVIKKIEEYAAAGKEFSAYNVTVDLRNENRETDMSHYDRAPERGVRSLVHDYMASRKDYVAEEKIAPATGNLVMFYVPVAPVVWTTGTPAAATKPTVVHGTQPTPSIGAKLVALLLKRR